MLITNTSLLTLVVQPYRNTTLSTTPDINPSSSTDKLAIQSVASALSADSSIASTDYLAPPGYSVCGTTGRLGALAGVYIRGDRVLSVVWRVAYHVADKVVSEFQPEGLQVPQTVLTCASSTISLASSYPDLNSSSLYTTALAFGSGCYDSYELLFKDEGAVEDAAMGRRHVTLATFSRP